MDERVVAVTKVINFSEKKIPKLEIEEIYEKEEQLKSAIIFAREYIKNTKITKDQLTYLCEEAIRG
jgi:magnesium chelatase subunit D